MKIEFVVTMQHQSLILVNWVY